MCKTVRLLDLETRYLGQTLKKRFLQIVRLLAIQITKSVAITYLTSGLASVKAPAAIRLFRRIRAIAARRLTAPHLISLLFSSG